MKEIVVKSNDINQRLDRFIRKLMPNLSLTAIYKLIRTKKIKVNNGKADIKYLLNLNDKIQMYINDEYFNKDKHLQYKQAHNDLEVVYEDDNILIVNKPKNILVYDEKMMVADTLANRVKKYLENKGQWKIEEEYNFVPSPIHRLDFNTSGLTIFAKNAQALQILNEKIKNHEIKKFYLAKIHGIFDEPSGTLKDYLYKDKTGNMVHVADKKLNDKYQEIITKYTTIYSNRTDSIIEIELVTGKTHQIRAHCNFYNHPLFGEKKYISKEFKDNEESQCLIAYKVIFNFMSSANILDYLNTKKVELPIISTINKKWNL